MNTRTAPWLVLLALLAGCRSEHPPNAHFDLGVDLGPWAGDLPEGCEPQNKLPAPTLKPFANPASYANYPFRGMAPGAVQLIATRGSASFGPVSVSPQGDFCIEVQLVTDGSSTVHFTPLDRIGCPGETRAVTLEHKTPAGVDGGGLITTLALGQPVAASSKPELGQLQDATDGDVNTPVKLSMLDTGSGSFAWLTVDLGKVYTVNRVALRWPSGVGGSYAAEYQVMLSGLEDPGTPGPNNSTWTLVGGEQQAKAEDQVLTLTDIPARWVALLLYENGTTDLKETFLVGEVEVSGYDPNATAPPSPEACK